MTQQITVYGGNEDVASDPENDQPLYRSSSRSARKNAHGEPLAFFDSYKSELNNPLKVVCRVGRESRSRNRNQAIGTNHITTTPNQLPWNNTAQATPNARNDGSVFFLHTSSSSTHNSKVGAGPRAISGPLTLLYSGSKLQQPQTTPQKQRKIINTNLSEVQIQKAIQRRKSKEAASRN